ncbi:MAG TPA: class I SAM-dependent methyltransferase [Verrucomicrobiae bacterium]|nr:class I SAM-dependent methyltransferase [Verrucomicrobiae bacterium]
MAIDILCKRLIGSAHMAVAYRPRVQGLCRLIVPRLREGDRVLDVGCGVGALAGACMMALPGVRFEGLERAPRGGEAIPVTRLEGDRFPFEDGAFDVVLLADVVHHEARPLELLRECRRVARREVLLKDHWHRSRLQYLRICALDWAANYAAGVRCLYRYGSPESWQALVAGAGFEWRSLESPLRLYHQPFEWIFGGRLHFMAVLGSRRVEGGAEISK